MGLEVVLESKPAGIRRPTHMALELEWVLATDPLLMRCHMLPHCIQG